MIIWQLMYIPDTFPIDFTWIEQPLIRQIRWFERGFFCEIYSQNRSAVKLGCVNEVRSTDWI